MKLKMAELYISFFKIGSLTFGGEGFAFPCSEEVVGSQKMVYRQRNCWIMCTRSGSAPGIIAVNTATYVGGYRQAGWSLGGMFGTLGVISPLRIITSACSIHLTELPSSSTVVLHALAGIRIIVCALDAECRSHHGKERNHWIRPGALLFVTQHFCWHASLSSYRRHRHPWRESRSRRQKIGGERIMIYLTLAFEFFKIGLFSIGGSMATLPFLMDLTTNATGTASDLANMVA